jgi:LacI family transcriptional regulator
LSRRVTLKDVARHAGVSTGTVSMVLNGSELISQPTRERVLRSTRELGYVYDRAAAQLRNKRTKIVGVSICDLANAYFAEIAAGVEQVLEQHGRVLVLGNSGESTSRQTRFLETLREYNVEGVLLAPAAGTTRATLQRLRDWRVPFVTVSRYVSGARADHVGSDNRLGAALATRHLIGLGHRRIAFVGLDRATTTGRDRFAGYVAALNDAGIAHARERVVECGATRLDGYSAIERLFQRARMPTAVVCFDDLVAFGAMLALRKLGLEPGRDCSVVGADDVDEAALWLPPLTTIAVDAAELGRMAAGLLRQRIERPDEPVRRVMMPPALVVRDTTGPPPHRSQRSPRRQV